MKEVLIVCALFMNALLIVSAARLIGVQAVETQMSEKQAVMDEQTAMFEQMAEEKRRQEAESEVDASSISES